MNTRFSRSIFAAACVAAASAAHALPRTERASFVLFAGGNVSMPGSFRGQTEPLQTSDPLGSTVYNDLKFSDAYKDGVTAGGEFDYAFDSHVSGFARAAYTEFDGSTHNIGEFEPTVDGTGHAISATFGDTATRELDLGARYTFMPETKLRPFVGAALGAAHLSATRAEVGNINGFGDTHVELAPASTVFQQRLETGLQFSPMRNFDLRLTAAATHTDGAHPSDDPNLALLGLNRSGGEVREHWDYPAELGAVWHF
jgi:hypothetical protein